MLSRMVKKIDPLLIRLYRRMSDPPTPNLRGDRAIENSWIAAHMPQGPGLALDFGSGPSSHLGLIAARRGFKVTAIDLTPVQWLYMHPTLEFTQVSIFDLEMPPESLDLVINCSTIEHVGLGRYGDQPGADGDLEAMQHMRSLLSADGIMLLTIPVGQDAVFAPLHRVDGAERLPELLGGYLVDREEYWVKDESNLWTQVSQEIAMKREPQSTSYGLGCFVLSKY